MKRLLVFFACFAFLASSALYAEEESSYPYSYARLSYVKGDVFIERAGDMGFEEGVVNLPVVEGDKMGTREGRAEIHFGRKNYLRIDSYTQLDFSELPKKGNDGIKIHLISGSVFLRVSYTDEDMSFEIHTPDASFYIVEAGLYRLNVRENRETELFVHEGAVEAAGEEGSLLVESEQKLAVSNGYFSSDPVDFYARLDDNFAQWNKDRDSLLSRPASSSYLPDELYEYEDELADNGRWVYEQPYGYVWVPYVVHSDWRPYYYGRWCWYPVIGWTWVSYDPWGWCVTHYGRWHWRWGLGWYWIPTRFWGPAWVHWYWGYDYVGWCPISYYGHPVVVVNNYFYGHDYGRFYPARSRALTVVHKSQFQARRISRVALSRDYVSRIEKISLSARQPSIRHRIESSSLRNSAASRVLSRNNLRKVERNYGSGKSLSVSRSRSKEAISSSRVIRKNAAPVNRRDLKEQPRRITGSREISRKLSAAPSKAAGSSSRISKSSAAESRMRTYPSRKSSLSRSSEASSSERRRTVSSREVKSPVERSTSRTYPSRIKKESLSERSRNSRSSSSRSSTLRSSSSSRIESPSTRKRISSSSSSLSSSLRRSGSRAASSVSPRRSKATVSRSSPVKRSSSRTSSSISSRSSSKSVSSRRSSASSSRMSSSRSGRSSSSRVSRSSSRSSSSRSSSRSSSGKSVKKK